MAAVELRTGEASAVGTNTMAAGVCVQIVSMFCYVFLAGDFLWKAMHDPLYRDTEEAHHGNVPLLSGGLYAATALILIRCFFRAVELSQGYDGYLFVHEGFFIGLEATPMVLVQLVFVFAHPLWTLPDHHSILDRFDTEDYDLGGGRTRSLSIMDGNEKSGPRRRPRREWVSRWSCTLLVEKGLLES